LISGLIDWRKNQRKEIESVTEKDSKKGVVKIHEVVKWPDPVLQKPGATVTVFDAKLKKLTEEMFESMYAAQGIGLAAPQIAISQRITVIDVSFQKNPEEKIVLINPEIIAREGKQVEEEGCLSLPEIREKVSRAAKVKVRAQDVKGEWFEIEGEELLARAFQHEIDHLDGVLFIDRLSRLKRDLVIRKMKKLIKNGEW
jgi:peptide deformylase